VSEVVKGHVSGSSRAEMVKEAQKRVAPFFAVDPKCVGVTLGPVTTIGAESFRADYEAVKHHEVERPVYGPRRCKNCEKTFYSSEEPNE